MTRTKKSKELEIEKTPLPILPMPDHVSVGVMELDPDAENTPRVPSILTKYVSADPEKVILLEAFLVATSIELTLVQNAQDSSKTIVLFTVSHTCGEEECPYLCSKIEFTVKNEPLTEFFQKLGDMPSFMWLCSTPTFEGRTVVHRPTTRIVSRRVEERLLN
jgi:hypothetical protein